MKTLAKLFAITLIVVITFAISGCTVQREDTNAGSDTPNAAVFVEIDNEVYLNDQSNLNGIRLVYDSVTKVVYIADLEGNATYVTAYLSENGKYCRYIGTAT